MIASLLPVITSPPANVLPYLDPGTGSYLFQILLAAGLSLLAVVGLGWKKITAFVSKLFGKKPAEPGKGGESSDDE